MRRDNKFWWFVIVSILFILMVSVSLWIMFWQGLSSQEKIQFIAFLKNYISFIFSMFFILMALFGLFLDWVFRIYILPINKLTEEVILIQSVNPSHRISVEGSRDVMRLVDSINSMVDSYDNMQKKVSVEIEYAINQVEEEKNTLAAIMAELSQGVLICNTEGLILFYNKQAQRFLLNKDDEEASASDRFIGLGRSVFNIINKNLIVHALDEIEDKMINKKENIVSYFVLSGQEGRLIRAEAVPIIQNPSIFTGFILILTDITNQLASDSRQSRLLQILSRGIRASLAGIRSAIEAIIEYPEMAPVRRTEFNRIIHSETIKLGDVLSKAYTEYADHFKSRWPLVPTLITSILEVIKKKAMEVLKLQLRIETEPGEVTIAVDSYLFVQTILFLLKGLQVYTGCNKYICQVQGTEKFVNIDLLWEGPPLSMDFLHQLIDKQIIVGEEGLPITFKDAIGHHQAEIWPHVHLRGKNAGIRLMLPSIRITSKEHRHRLGIQLTSRTEFYDFDLFHQPGQTPELDNCNLHTLTYTVFDTETTGLDPKGGDEIISIGAVRIVNGRILREEFFDSLVDPKRSIPTKSIRIHGIQPHMVEGQPKITEVLPRFHRFCEDTILIGHNVAFDMSMLQIKESETQVVFDHPVLDTLLLSDVVHPSHKRHNIEAIALRLGVNIFGRHTALGDAIVTGGIFLKMIPLLENMGIYTLKEARIASQRTYLARLKY
jgi:DNA polymerase-3 subunit epsilon